ncbi:MAG: MFS transporter [Gammaproteobacteria bacterium]|nr:MFS transporter [Gammaproteobacteria bacterium]
MKPDPTGLRWGPLWLSPGISRMNATAFMFASFITIGFMIYINQGHSYVLNENLQIPIDQQGNYTGLFLVINEITLFVLMPVAGIISDRIGRRIVMVSALLLMALGYVLYPLAESITELAFYRVLFAAGAAGATGMLGTIMHDYPQDVSRGRTIALSGIMVIFGSLVVAGGFGQLPTALVARGFDGVTAGQYAFWSAAACVAAACVLLQLGLQGGLPTRVAERLPVAALIRSGWRNGRNPRIALAYAAAFVARSDLVILGSFTVLWGTIAGREAGMDTADSVRQGVLLFVMAQGAAALWSYFMGLITDRCNRVTAMMVGAALGAAGFLSMWLVENPLDRASLPLFWLLGIGQISCFHAAQALIGQEAPVKERGAVIGMFGLFGALGIAIATYVGGIAFDQWMRAGPFVIVGLANLVILLLALLVRLTAPGRMPGEVAAAQ